jgi:Proteasome assembly chaperone 4
MEFAVRSEISGDECPDNELIPTESFVIELPDDGITVIGNAIVMDRSCYIWLGAHDSLPVMGALAMAMPTRFENNPLASELIQSRDSLSSEMATRISKRFKIQTFISCNLPESYESHMAAVDRRLIEILGKYFTK